MAQEEKQLLIQDLSARLPYGVIVHCKGEYQKSHEVEEIDVRDEVVRYFEGMHLHEESIINCFPYLRPMSSMTEEEIIEFNNIPSTKNYTIIENGLPWDVAHYKQIDWLNKKMFDFRGLIPRGCALSTEVFNPY